ncbi:MAG TPA: DNA polymerase III subunit delta' C-terminal domain-containing protein, partial [Ardenticatenaceae bacterium]|nr:DNA polymerase III subunit delta' C-terminal domain-containing protein [Ardenticatenaceae bacterium]
RRLLDEREIAAAYKVETIRRLQRDLSRRPVEARGKVVLLLEGERLTTAAANAFLKTLEEPPPYVVLLLTARDKGVLLPTIISRCQVLLLRPAPVGQIETFLRTLPGASAEQAALVARLSGGRVGWAVRAAGSGQQSKPNGPGLLDERRAALEALTTALRSTRTDRLALAQTLAKQEDLRLLATWAGWWRDALLIKHGTPEAVTNIDARPSLEQVAARLPEPEIRRALHALQHTLGLLEETNVNAQLAWEVLLLQLPRLA